MKRYLCPVLIGRGDTMAELRGALDGATQRQGSSHFLVGEAGVGKTRLAREAAAEARSLGFNVLHGRGVDAHDVVAFRPLTEALFSYFRDAQPPDLPDLEPFWPSLSRLVPEWGGRRSAVPDDSIVVLAEAVLRLLRVLGQGAGCLLVLDDLHWADPDTLAIVRYLAQNISSEPIVCLGTLRREDSVAARGLVSSLVAQRTAYEHELDSLDEPEIVAIARACLAVDELPKALEDLVAGHADGLPYLVEELLASAANSGALVEESDGWTAEGPLVPALPLNLIDGVDGRLARLGDDASVLVTASVLGRQFDWRLLPAMTGLDELGVLAALRAGVDAQLLLADPSTENAFRFRHALTRDAVLRRLLPMEREVLSRRALQEVETAHPDLPGEWCVLAARLAETAGDLPRAAALLVRSGREALLLGALAGAEGTFERARRLTDVPEIAADAADGLCEALVLAGDYDRAKAVGAELLDALAAVAAPAARVAGVHLRLARAAISASDADAAEQHLERARTLIAGGDLGAVAAHADTIEARVATRRGDYARAGALAADGLRAAERLGLHDLRCEALEVLGRVARTHDSEAAEDAFESALRVATEHGLVVWRIRALFELCTIDLYLARSADRMLATRELANSSGALATAAQVDLHLAHWCVDRFELEDSIEAARRSHELARRFHMDELLAAGLVAEATACGRLGHHDDMEALVREALTIVDTDPTLGSVIWGHCRAMASLVAENRPRALRELEAAMAILRAEPSSVYYPERGLWALLRSVSGPDGASACAEVRESGATSSLIVRGYLDFADAVLHGRAGRVEQAETAFAAGDAALTQLDWLRHHARRLVAEAAVADGWGEPAIWLNQALVVFEDRGQERLTAACRSLLRKAGAPVPRRAADSAIPAALRAVGVTARELEVLTLLADGMGNKDIAARLYCSPRTVERHVANLSAKSGRATRAELVAYAARIAAD